MARYRATCEGKGKTEASRLGTAGSGIQSYTNGWNLGAAVSLEPDRIDEEQDVLLVTLNNGSGQGNYEYGRITMRLPVSGNPLPEGTPPRVSINAHLLMHVAPEHLAGKLTDLHRIYNDAPAKAYMDTLFDFLILDDEFARMLRGKLFVSGKASQP